MKIAGEEIKSGRPLSEVLAVAEARRIYLTEEWIQHLISCHISTTESPEQKGKPTNKKDLHD
jgi:hypothetical protein